MNKRRTQRFHKLVEADLEIMPLMNLFVVLIPMLLLSAVFVEIAAIRMSAPGDGADVEPPAAGLDLAIVIQPEAYLVRGRDIVSTEIPRTDRNDVEAADRLLAALEGIALEHPGNEAVRIISQDDTKYDEIVAVMDRSRDAGMPRVSLQAGD